MSSQHSSIPACPHCGGTRFIVDVRRFDIYDFERQTIEKSDEEDAARAQCDSDNCCFQVPSNCQLNDEIQAAIIATQTRQL